MIECQKQGWQLVFWHFRVGPTLFYNFSFAKKENGFKGVRYFQLTEHSCHNHTSAAKKLKWKSRGKLPIYFERNRSELI